MQGNETYRGKPLLDVLNIRSILPRRWIGGLYLVRSPPLPEKFCSAANGAEVYCSSFNPSWLSELNIKPRVIIDVGSYDGGDALKLSKAFPEARIVTIEADPFRATIVRQNLAATDIEIVEAAVQDHEGLVEWFPALINGTPDASGSIFLMTEKEAAKRSHINQVHEPARVRGRRLSALIHELGIEGIDLLHMDIQGAEHAALLGLGEHRPRMIYLEVGAAYEGAPSTGEVHALLRRMGYRLAADFRTDRLYVESV